MQVEGVAIPYADLPGFPHVGVSGHNPNLHVGTLEGVRVAVFGAREHYYESGNPRAMLLAFAGPEGAGGGEPDPDQCRRLDAPGHPAGRA
jgi:purine-nucleoside phosphorylase